MSLYQRLKSDPQLEAIPVIITSALSPAKELKDVDYLTLPDGTRLPEPEAVVEKPIGEAQFLAKVKEIIEGNHDTSV
jgi:hypothetical protein